MSRIDEALRRARPGASLPESITTPRTRALERFATTETDDENGMGPEDASVETAQKRRAILSDARTLTPPADGNPSNQFANLAPEIVEKLVVHSGLGASSVEQYRRLAATLHHTQNDRGIKVVMVASALAGEGKTLTAVNLSLTLSESYGRRVLLIDADLRRPMLHELFGVPNVSGLNEGLKAEADQRLTPVEVSPRLLLLAAGKPEPDPMSGLTSDRMRQVLQDAAATFDWVILDTPPVGLLPDANLLAAMVDVVVVVVGAGIAPCRVMQRAVEALGRDRIIGVVLNRVAGEAGDYYAPYSSGYDARS